MTRKFYDWSVKAVIVERFPNVFELIFDKKVGS